jgi:thiol-disulfide isomerase/thioredoxin
VNGKGGATARSWLLALGLLLCCAPGSAFVVRPSPQDTYRALDLPAVNVAYRSSTLVGHPVVVAFLASYCLPCVAQIQYLQKLQTTHAKTDLRIVVVGFDLEGARTLEPFSQVYGLTFPVLVADERLRTGASVFGRIPALPATIVLGRDGVERATFAGLPEKKALEKVVQAALE